MKADAIKIRGILPFGKYLLFKTVNELSTAGVIKKKN